MTVRVSAAAYSWHYTVHETGSRAPMARTNRSHAPTVCCPPQSRGTGRGIGITAGDYETLSQHLVRLIRPDRWIPVPHRSVIRRSLKEIHVLTHVVALWIAGTLFEVASGKTMDFSFHPINRSERRLTLAKPRVDHSAPAEWSFSF